MMLLFETPAVQWCCFLKQPSALLVPCALVLADCCRFPVTTSCVLVQYSLHYAVILPCQRVGQVERLQENNQKSAHMAWRRKNLRHMTRENVILADECFLMLVHSVASQQWMHLYCQKWAIVPRDYLVNKFLIIIIKKWGGGGGGSGDLNT